MKALFDSLVRTYVPWIVGIIVGWLVNIGVPLDAEVEVQLTITVAAVAAFLYYFLARVFELYISPKFGWLLGLAKQPVYADSDSMHVIKSSARDINSLYPFAFKQHGFVLSGLGKGTCAACGLSEANALHSNVIRADATDA